MDKPVLYMLCGLSGSGKSEYAKEFKKESEELNSELNSEYRVHIFSSDDLREELYGDTNDQSHNNELFNELHRRIKSCLKNGHDAIYDATNIKSKLRIAFLKELKNIPCHKVCLIIWRPYHECILLNRGRDRIISDHVIKKQYMNWQTPWYFEGWDNIELIGDDTFSTYYWNEIYKYKNFKQHNYHHNLTLYDHLIKTGEYIRRKDDNNHNLIIAGQLHDIGKPFTKTFKNKKGQITEDAHYYQHHCVGAYDALGLYYGRSPHINNVLISAYITYHMQPYFWRDNPKNEQKYKKLWGDDFYNNILLLHEADKEAH